MFKALMSLFRRPPAEPAGSQYGALPYRIVDGQLVVLLITSRGRGQWIFPKGRQMQGKTPWDSAAQEAFEEAGVVGDVETAPIGSYFLPVTEERPRPIEVKIFPLRVTEQRDDWKEKDQRHRQWAELSQATRLITHDGLADVALALAHREVARTGE